MTLHLSKNWPCRVWVNGTPTEPATADAIGWLSWTRVPVVLRPGRNTILVKTASQRFLALLSDAPAARAWELFKFGDFDRAVQAYARVLQGPAHEWIVRHACFAALVTGDQETYRAFSKRLPTYSNLALDAERNAERDILDTEVYASTEVPEADLPRLKKILERWYDIPERKREPWFERMLAWSHYRLGEFERVVAILKYHPNEPHMSPVLAMAYHRLGQQDLARQWLARADAVVDQRLKDFAGNGQEGLWLIYPTYREAVELIRGDAFALDIRFDEFLAQRRRLWEARDRLVSAFDDAISNAPHDPRTYLARGRRLAELDRFDQAAADFAKVLEVMPHEEGSYWDTPRKRLCAHLAQWPEVFDKVVQLRPGDLDLWIGLARYHHLHNRWEEAAATYARVDQSHPRNGEWGEYAALLLLAGDDVGYRKLCLRLFEKEKLESPAYVARMAALSPNPPLDPAHIVSLAQRGKTPNTAWTRHTLCLAHYRAGAWEAAMRLLQEPNQPGWGHPQASGKLLQAQLNELLLAMCQFRMGQVEEAQKRLTSACKVIDQATCYTVEDPFLASPFDWPPLILLRREAEALILKQTDLGTPTEKTKSEAMK